MFDLPTDDNPVVIIHGDCLDILPQIPDGVVDAVVTDPPWNCGYFGDNDNVPWQEYSEMLSQWVHACEQVCDGQVWFLSTKSLPYVANMFGGYIPFAAVKNFSQMVPTKLPNCWDIAFIRDNCKAYLGNGRNWFLSNTAGMMSERTNHPTPRGVDVMRYTVSMYSWDTILDPFAGSGTTGVAAILEGRKAILIEKDAGYVEVIKKRIKHALCESPSQLPFKQPTLVKV